MITQLVRSTVRMTSAAAFTALVLVSTPPTQDVAMRPSLCTIGETVREQPTQGEAISLVCIGAGIGGQVGGAGISIAKPSTVIPRRPYGEPGSGKVVTSKVSPKRMKRFAREQEVPWPSSTAKRASDMSSHDVYQIYGKAKSGKTKVFKYGITKTGPTRPESQVRACRKVFTDCTWQWVRKDVRGWEKARQWEAHHAARYKAKFGHCPPGMTRCL